MKTVKKTIEFLTDYDTAALTLSRESARTLSELKAIAEVANDPWGKGLNVALVMNTFNDTFDPPTVKALIERIEELEERTIPDDLTSYIQERVKAERERCADIVNSYIQCGFASMKKEILNPTESEASDDQ